MNGTSSIIREAGSFRDPRGFVFRENGRLFRCIRDTAIKEFVAVERTGLFSRWQEAGVLARYSDSVPDITYGDIVETGGRIIELDPVDFVSHPYEWTFSGLKAAALLQLRMLLEALESGVFGTDATAYNVQFDGTQPLFIDQLSWRPYTEGELWQGHGQFCEQYLFPLMLQAYCGVPFNDWYRGRLEGISGHDLLRILPLRRRLQPRALMHLVLPQLLERWSSGKTSGKLEKLASEKNLPKSSLAGLLQSLERWISGLQPAYPNSSAWSEYYSDNTYLESDAALKRTFVAEAVTGTAPKMLWDMGCNTGLYSEVALEAGASVVIGFEADPQTADIAFQRATDRSLRFLPLVQNFANPSPSQGWRAAERQGLESRAQPDFILALALVHHMRFSANIPLRDAIAWLVSLAPEGIIEFPQKHDPMVQQLIKHRVEPVDDYTESNFITAIGETANIVKQQNIGNGKRILIQYCRKR